MDEFASGMLRFIEANQLKYDLIHAHFWMSGYVATIIKHTLSIPYVITFHALGRIRRIYQGPEDEFPDRRFEIEEEVARHADVIIAECPQDKEDLIVHYMADSKKIHIVPCGFDKEEFYPLSSYHSKTGLGLNTSTFTLLQLGRMVKRKGIDNVILGLAEFCKLKDASVKLLIVGGESDHPDPEATPEIARLADIARKENILDKVTFAGRKARHQLKYYYNAADTFITTPWYEPFGITPLEAMACGTPVIGSNVGGIKYSIAHGETGFLVPPNDPELLGKRIADLYDNRNLRQTFSLNAIKRVNSHFTWEKIGHMMGSVYFRVLKTPKPIIAKLQYSFSELMTHIRAGKTVKEENIN